MAKLHFRYGAMGSSKTAQALMTRFNYLEKGRNVWLLKPATDTRDGATVVKSRIGLEAEADVVESNDNILEKHAYKTMYDGHLDVIIVDEAQFLTQEQVLQLRKIVSAYNTPVLCFGLRTDFQCKLFPGSKALFEVADEIQEVSSICQCGAKALVNARVDENGRIITEGDVVDIGGNEKYKGMCWTCYQRLVAESTKN